jgi:DNA-binding NarL/FixJ family response regulator
MREISVLVVADGVAVVRGLRRAARRDRALSIVGPVPDATGVLLASTAPDLIVVDLARQDGLGLDVLARVRELMPAAPILATTPAAGPEVASSVLSVGAAGLLPDTSDGRVLRDAVERAIAGELVLPDDDLALVVSRLRDARRASSAERIISLTVREQQVLGLIAEGWATGEVATQLAISAQTVQSHVKNILAKLGVHSKVEAVRVAWRCGAVAIPA